MSSSCAWRRRVALFLGFLMIMLFAGCGNSANCALKGDNLKGRVTFAGNVLVQPEASVVVEWSKDSFATVSGRSISKPNVQGLLSVPYSLCVDNDINVQVRGYEDINDNITPDGSEYAGRYDQTSNGDAPFVNVQVHASTASGSTQSTWEIKEGVDLVIDTP